MTMHASEGAHQASCQVWMECAITPTPHTHTPPTQYEAIPESLKNMLLVMSTQGIFDIVNSSQSDPSIHLSAKDAISQLLWQQTQERVEKFLPNLLRDLFPGLASPKKATPTKEVTVATVAVAVPSPAGSPIRSTSASPLSTSPGEWALVCIMYINGNQLYSWFGCVYKRSG